MRIERERLHIARITEDDLVLELHYLYRGTLASILKRSLLDSAENIQRESDICGKISENIICVIGDSVYLIKTLTENSELRLDASVFELLNYCTASTELHPEVSGDKLDNLSTVYIYVDEAVERYSQVKLDTAHTGTKQLISYFCSFCSKPWILKVIDLENFRETLLLSSNLNEHISKICSIIGLRVRNIVELLNNIHTFSEEFARFLITVVEIPDAVFTATVMHHGKERAHKYVINIPQEVRERLGLCPGARVEVKLRVLK